MQHHSLSALSKSKIPENDCSLYLLFKANRPLVETIEQHLFVKYLERIYLTVTCKRKS